MIINKQWKKVGAMNYICLHGLGSTRHYFQELQSLLEAVHFSAIDLPGHGDEPPLENTTLATLIEWLHVKITKPVTLIGHSFGGTLALAYAQAFPDNVVQVMLLDGGYLQSRDLGVTLAEEMAGARQFVAQMTFPSFEAMLEAEKKQATRWNPFIEEATIQRFSPTNSGEIALKIKTETAVALTQIQYHFSIPTVSVPVTLLTATEPLEIEDIREKARQRFISRLPQTTVIRIEAGHDLLVDNPQDVANILNEERRV